MRSGLFVSALIAALSCAPAFAEIRPQVRAPAQDALHFASLCDFTHAFEKLRVAEAVKNKTAEEATVLSQLRTYFTAKAQDRYLPCTRR